MWSFDCLSTLTAWPDAGCVRAPFTVSVLADLTIDPSVDSYHCRLFPSIYGTVVTLCEESLGFILSREAWHVGRRKSLPTSISGR